jgi:hypothetical protein
LFSLQAFVTELRKLNLSQVAELTI